MADFLAEVQAISPEIIQLRQELHAHPEVGIDLPWTQAKVLQALEGLDLEITKGTKLTSITAILRGAAAPENVADRPVVLLRADMDGLPVTETTGMPFASTIGTMHACGHDLHTAGLTGAVKLLHAHKDELPGDVVFMFQPGEEIFQGSRLMIEEGVLDAAGKRADRAFGMHVMSAKFPSGNFASRPGTIMAGCDYLRVDIIGKGGHGSAPHLSNDPVPVMGEILTALQVLAAKKFDVFDPVVINTGIANAGQATNVIPEKCRIEAAIRTFSPENRQKMEVLTRQLVEHICAAYGMAANVVWDSGTGPTLCDPDMTAFAFEQMEAIVGPDRYYEMTLPLTGSEDFASVLEDVPGTFIFYSGVPDGVDHETAPYNHAPNAWFDDKILPEATALLAQLGYESLRDLASA